MCIPTHDEGWAFGNIFRNQRNCVVSLPSDAGAFTVKDNIFEAEQPGFKFSLKIRSSSSFEGLLLLSLGPSLTNLKWALSKSIRLRLGINLSPFVEYLDGVLDFDGVFELEPGVFLGVIGRQIEDGVVVVILFCFMVLPPSQLSAFDFRFHLGV